MLNPVEDENDTTSNDEEFGVPIIEHKDDQIIGEDLSQLNSDSDNEGART